MSDTAERAEQSRIELAVQQAALYRLTDRLLKADTLDDMFEAALDAIREALGAERASILLFDAKGVMRFVASRGLSEAYRTAVDGHTPWKQGDLYPEPICLTDIDQSTESDEIKRTIRSEDIRGLCFMPVLARGAVIGKFMTYYRAPHVFIDEEIALARQIARQLGFCIERHRADEARATLAAIVTTSSDAIVSKDTNGTIVTWNAGAERIFGYKAEEVVGKSITILIPPERLAEEDQILARIRRGEGVDHFETVRRRKDGSAVDISLTVSPIRDARGVVVGASKIARDISDRKRHERQQVVLMNELNHRVKNTLASVQSIVLQTLRNSESTEQAERQVNGRLVALSKAHDVLTQSSWEGAQLGKIIERAIAPHCTADVDRFHLHGPDVWLSPKHALAVTMALHELCTNAAKYGALSKDEGRIEVDWTLDQAGGKRELNLVWREKDGPPVAPPTRRGFGSRLIERGLSADLDGNVQLEFKPSGVICSLTANLATAEPA